MQSFFKQSGLSVSVWQPSIVAVGSNYAYNPKGTLITDSLEALMTSYGQTIRGDIGFDKQDITIRGSKTIIEDWIEKGLNRHVEVKNDGDDIVFEAFVNEFAASLGGLSYSGGPVLDVENRVMVTYTPIDYNASPPAKGPKTETALADDTESQLAYGILEAVIQGGEDTPDGAEQSRDTQLADMSTPGHSVKADPSASGKSEIKLSLLGYGHRLNHYVYNDTTTGSISLSDKIITALDADPNNLISAERDYIITNALLLAAEETDNSTAWKVIKELLPAGTPQDRRTFFGVYENRVPHYWVEPTDIRYRYHIANVMQQMEEGIGNVPLDPWDVRPGYWVFMPDFLSGRNPPPVVLRTDPRIFLVESVQFTAPDRVSINGERFGSAKQLLAKKGLGCI